ncbi:TatD family hydrolase [Sansalvadorimonas verongulae]|uniref:TatD family hydrolase n=1 Tax=Sansalvadorimonas verongulae TaxID=2172824 RepID=UPI0012BD080C|nr:TatD family hydrolase [Sansalvadorimonas verongulae]MTI14658.1 TatD family deoxyribonuclease [Sansalvadorimonas verongulae]
MFVDSHCHLDRLDLAPYNGDIRAAIAAANEAGVNGILCVCIDMENFPAVLKLAQQNNVWASVGVHPLEGKSREATAEELLECTKHDKVVAIGETGLDYYYAKDEKEKMQQRFVTQLQVAAQSQLPVIIHTRDARRDTLDLMHAHASQESAGVLHCFTENWDMAKAAMDMNFYISLSGIVTFRNADALRDVAKKVPLDRLLIETDAPYLAPVPHRGKSNEPKYVADVARYLAELKGVSVEELAQATTDNFFRLFNKASLTQS